jgi:hypothetical protein
MVPLDTLTVTYGRTSDVQPLSNAYKNWITQFQDIYDHCNSQTAWSDHNIFDLTSSHFDSYCFLISHNHDWLPPVLPLWHCTYAPTCHQIPLVPPKCSFLRNHTTFMMRRLTHLPILTWHTFMVMVVYKKMMCPSPQTRGCWNDGYGSGQQNNDIFSYREGLTSLETPWQQPKPWLGVNLYW